MRFLRKPFFAILASLAFLPVQAEEAWPNHPVKFTVGFEPVGANDLVARADRQALQYEGRLITGV